MDAAKARAAANISSGVDRQSRSEAVAKSKVDAIKAGAAKRSASSRMLSITDGTLVDRAAAADPPRLPLGLIDLTRPQPASKDDLTQECDARGLKPKSGALRAVQRDGGPGEPKLKINELKELLLPHCLAGTCLLEQKRPDESDLAGSAGGADWGHWGHQKKKPRLVGVEAGREQSPTAGGAAPAAKVTQLPPPSEEPTAQTPMQVGAPAVGTAEAIAHEAPAPAPTPTPQRSGLRAIGVRRKPSRFEA